MELQLLFVLLIAFLVLGPEGMLNVATKLGELMRKVREIIDQIKMEAYLEEINRKIMEEEKNRKEEPPKDIAEELKSELEDVYEGENLEEEKREDERPREASRDASNGTSEGAKV